MCLAALDYSVEYGVVTSSALSQVYCVHWGEGPWASILRHSPSDLIQMKSTHKCWPTPKETMINWGTSKCCRKIFIFKRDPDKRFAIFKVV